MKNVRLQVLVAALVAVVGVGIACSRDSVTGTGGGTPPRGASSTLRASLRRAPRPQPPSLGDSALAVRLASVRSRVAWIGAFHTELLNDFVANRARWVGMDMRNTSAVCAGIARVVLAHLPQAASHGVSRSDQADREDVQAALHDRMPECAPSPPMSLFRIPGWFANASRPLVVDDSDVTGDFEYYVDLMATEIAENTDGSASAVSAVTSSVLSSASSLPEPDLGVVAAAAELANSSAAYWEAQASSGGIRDTIPNQMSLFLQPRNAMSSPPPYSLFALLIIVGADAWACVAGELSALHGGHRSESYLYHECAIWGGAGSIIASMPFLRTPM